MNESDKENKNIQKGNNRRIIGNYQLGFLYFLFLSENFR